MKGYAYYNGKFGKRDDITIPLSDRSIFFGDAIYDAAIGSHDRILWESEHIQRFLDNANRLEINHNLTEKYLSQLLREVAVKSTIENYFIYFQLSRDLKTRTHSAMGCGSNLLITIDPIEIKSTFTPLKLVTAEDLRYGYCDVKTVNLLPAVLSATKAERIGCDEAVFIKEGIVTECTKSNISIIKHGRVVTHPKSNKILPGITREHLRMICDKIGIPFDEKGRMVKLISEKNAHEMTALCRECGVSDENISLLRSLLAMNGAPDVVLPRLEELLAGKVSEQLLRQLRSVVCSLEGSGVENLLRIDFSVVDDMHYYNGFVFKGFVRGLPGSVLSGGQYDKLMEKMKRQDRAIGFAVYADLLDRLEQPGDDYDVDVLLIYDDAASLAAIRAQAERLRSQGASVMVSRAVPEDLRCRNVMKFAENEVTVLENNA
jgi:branched-subunit amino acid aminotransferase/4-amino-4-deoxychorismate lyase